MLANGGITDVQCTKREKVTGWGRKVVEIDRWAGRGRV